MSRYIRKTHPHMTYAEIAEKLGILAAAAKDTGRRGMKKMLKMAKKRGLTKDEVKR